MKNKVLSFMLVIIMLFSFASCSSFNTSGTVREDYPLTVGNIKFEDTPKNVVVLSDNIADIIYACGYEMYIAGVSDECTQSELSRIAKVGSKSSPDIDKIKELSADLIILDEKLSDEYMTEIKNTGIPFIIMAKAEDEESLVSLYESIASVFGGKITGKAKGNRTITNIIKNMQEINAEIPASDVVCTICYLYNTDNFAVTGDNFISDILEYTDAINIFDNNTDNVYLRESLKLADPTFIICDEGVAEKLKSDELLSSLTAVKNGKVLEIPSNKIARQGRSMLEVITQITYFMYPELIPTEKDNTSSENENDESDVPSDNISDNSSQISSNESSNESAISTINISDDTVLKKGDKGDLVLQMQKRLNALGYDMTNPTGEFTDGTEQAIKSFQLLNNYNTTGIANAELLRLLFSDEAIPNS